MAIVSHDFTVAVTGASSGLGLATVLELASRGVRVVPVVRRPSADMKELLAAHRVRVPLVVEADLADLTQVQRAAAALSDVRPDVIAHVAAVSQPPNTRTRQGFDTTFVTNHLSAHYLTRELLRSSPQIRVGMVTSSQHRRVRSIPWDSIPTPTDHRKGLAAYQQTKLFNILLARHLRNRAVPTFSYDPGFVRTRLGQHARGWFKAMLVVTAPLQVEPTRPARHFAELLLDPSRSGDFNPQGAPANVSPTATDDGVADRLWTLGEQLLTGVGLPPGT